MLTQYVAGIPRDILIRPKGRGDSLSYFYKNAVEIWRDEIALTPRHPEAVNQRAIQHWTRLLGISEIQLRTLVADRAANNEQKAP